MNNLRKESGLQWIRLVTLVLENIPDSANVKLLSYGVCGDYLHEIKSAIFSFVVSFGCTDFSLVNSLFHEPGFRDNSISRSLRLYSHSAQ